MPSSLGGLLHKIRDALLVAASELERGDEAAAAETITDAANEIREELKAK